MTPVFCHTSSMKVAIVGYGMEGKASCDYFLVKGADVTVCDKNTDTTVPDGAKTKLGSDYLEDLDQFDVIVRTPGMHPDLILEKNPDVGSKITTQINEFLRVCPTRNVIGVTGTKGKGTTSTLIVKMLEASGKKVTLAGNIGEPALTHLGEITPESWVVLELSSFQLINLQRSPRVAVCLMVVPEHLNWHADMNEYLTAKMQLFAHQTREDVAIYFAGNENSKEVASAGGGQKIPYFQSPGAYVDEDTVTIDDQAVCRTDELKLLGRHNWQNACAAITAVWTAGVHDIEAMRQVLTSFTGLEHRLEFVRELDGVKYYDDSFGTTPETAMVAIEAFSAPKVVILGGSDKGTPFDQLAETVAKQNVRTVVLIGQMGPAIKTALEENDYTEIVQGGSTMQEIVATAREAAQPGDVILLSTSCASFDMFKDYKDRGNQFKTAVRALSS